MKCDKTVQTEVPLQNIRYIFELGPDMKVAWEGFDFDFCCSDCQKKKKKKKKIGYGSHMGKKVGFRPILPEV